MAVHLRDRIAGAPISWGVCEVPGWGYQLPPAVVLGQMRDTGLTATEFGPDGFLPDSPAAKAETLAEYGLSAVGQFAPAILHRPDVDPLPAVTTVIAGLVAAGASTLVLAAATGADGYDVRPELDPDGWSHLLGELDRLAAVAADSGLTATLHPHVGTMVQSGVETRRVLDGCGIGLCLDTGHLLIGGGDPVAIARDHPDRVAHVHLKDVRADLADRVRAGDLTYTQAVAQGLYVALGDGDVDIRAIVKSLESNGYQGWYVLEQDTSLAAEPGTAQQPHDPVQDVRRSVAMINRIAADG